MDINNLALVRVINMKNINFINKPKYVIKKIHGTKLYDTIINKLNMNKSYHSINHFFNDIYKLLPYSIEYSNYNTFYINKIVKKFNMDDICIIIEPLKNQISNISLIDKDKVLIDKNISLSNNAVMFTNINNANSYLKENYNIKVTKDLIKNIKKNYNISEYYNSIILEEEINNNKKLNKICENKFYNYIKNYLNLDDSLSLIEIIESIDINRYKYLVKKYNNMVLKRGIKYEE